MVILTIFLAVIRPMPDSAIKLSKQYFSEVLEAYGAFNNFSTWPTTYNSVNTFIFITLKIFLSMAHLVFEISNSLANLHYVLVSVYRWMYHF